MTQFHERNGWRIEDASHPDYQVRVCRKAGDCQKDVWGYYTAEEVKRNVHFSALERAAKSRMKG